MRLSQLDAMFSREELVKLAQFLDENPRLGTDAFREALAERGLLVSRSTAHTYQRKLERIGLRMRQSRLVLAGLSKELGSSAAQGREGRALIEMTRTLVYEYQEALLEGGGEGLEPKDFAHLGRALESLSKALNLNADFELKAREAAVAAERDRAAAAAGKAAAKAGLSADTAAAIRAAIEGAQA